MKVEEKNETALKQDQSNGPQNKKDTDVVIEKDKIQDEKNKEESNGKKVKELEEKVLRTLAEMENQRRRFEKEREEAFEFGGFAFAKESLALIDNLERARTSFINNKDKEPSEKAIAPPVPFSSHGPFLWVPFRFFGAAGRICRHHRPPPLL